MPRPCCAPADTGEVAAVLGLCREAGVPVVPQGGNTGLVGGGVPSHGEVVLSLARLDRLGPVDADAAQVTAGAGVTLQRVADADPALDLGVLIASRGSATVGGAIATNAGGLRVLRYGPMRAQVRGVTAVLADGTVVSHLAGLVKDNTGYDYPGLLCRLGGDTGRGHRGPDPARAPAGRPGHGDRRAGRPRRGARTGPRGTAHRPRPAVGGVLHPGRAGRAGRACRPGAAAAGRPAFLLLEAGGPGAVEDLAAVAGDRPVAVGTTAADRARLWACRERHPEAAGFLGVPLKLDVSVPAAHWVRLASEVGAVARSADPGAQVISYGHVADGNLHVNVVPAAEADGRHEDAVFGFVASLGGSISAEHGIGALKARWLPLARTAQERALFARIRAAFDPDGILNPHVLPR